MTDDSRDEGTPYKIFFDLYWDSKYITLYIEGTMGIPHPPLGGFGGCIYCPKLHDRYPTQFRTFQTPNNGFPRTKVINHYFMTGQTIEYWLMGFMRILIRPHYVLHNRSKGPTLK